MGRVGKLRSVQRSTARGGAGSGEAGRWGDGWEMGRFGRGEASPAPSRQQLPLAQSPQAALLPPPALCTILCSTTLRLRPPCSLSASR